MMTALILLALALVARAVIVDIKHDKKTERDIERRLDEAHADLEATRAKNAQSALSLHLAKRANERTNPKEREHVQQR